MRIRCREKLPKQKPLLTIAPSIVSGIGTRTILPPSDAVLRGLRRLLEGQLVFAKVPGQSATETREQTIVGLQWIVEVLKAFDRK